MSPELLAAALTYAFWAIALIVVGWKTLPLVFQFVGLSRMTCAVVEQYPREIAVERTEEYAAFRRQALELGFKPLGILVRRMRFVSGYWSLVQAETIYGSNIQECFAGAGANIHTGVLERGASTSQVNGVMIWTANTLELYDLTTNDLVLRRVDTANFVRLLRQQQEHVRQYRTENVALADHERVETLLDSLRRHTAGPFDSADDVVMRDLFKACLFCVIVPITLSYGLCRTSATIPLTMLIGAVLHTAWLRWHVWTATRLARREHAQRLQAENYRPSLPPAADLTQKSSSANIKSSRPEGDRP